MSFALGQKVEWKSQSGSYYKKKTGVVLSVVPAWPGHSERICLRLINFIPPKYQIFPHMFDGWQRRHECYIVLVEGPRGAKKIYCPVVSQLRAVKP